MRQYLDVLKNKNFFLLWLGQGVSDVGSRIHTIALIWLVADITGSATGVGLLFMAMTVPRIIVFPIAGVLVERWSKKQVIILTDVLRGLVAISIAMTNNITAIYALSALMIVFELFFAPAIRTVIPRIVEKDDLLTANALSAVTGRTASLVGPALGGVIIALFGIRVAFIVNGISFIVSAISEAFIAIPAGAHETSSQASRNIRKEFLEGWHYIKDSYLLRFVVFFFAFVSLPFGAVTVLKVVLLTDVLGFSADQYGLLMTIEGGGLLIGSLLMGALGKKYPETTAMVLGVGMIGAFYFALSYSPFFLTAAMLLFCIGLFATIANIAYGTFLQKAVADEYRSRVFSFDIALGDMFAFISMGLAGLLGDTFGVTRILGLCGALIFTLCLLATRLPIHRHVTAPGD
jgi:MFS family permease